MLALARAPAIRLWHIILHETIERLATEDVANTLELDVLDYPLPLLPALRKSDGVEGPARSLAL